MAIFNIFVLGEFGSDTTSFVRTVCQRDTDARTRQYFHPYNTGSIPIDDEGVLNFFAWSRNFSIQGLIETLAPASLRADPDLGQMFESFSEANFSNAGMILLIDSAAPELDEANQNLLQNIQFLMRYQRFPYVVALSNQTLPEARTATQMRAAVAVPDTIKVIPCDVKEPNSARQVVIEVLDLMPHNDAIERLIEQLSADG